MNKQLRTLVAFFAIATAAAAPAFCSELEPLRVTVPFAFKAGVTSLPAGDYTVLTGNSHIVMIRGSHGSAILLATAGEGSDSDKSSLSFERSGKGYYLKAIRSVGHPASLLRVNSPAE